MDAPLTLDCDPVILPPFIESSVVSSVILCFSPLTEQLTAITLNLLGRIYLPKIYFFVPNIAP
jgi:hypothetical protein